VDVYGSWLTQLRKGVVELLVLGLLDARGALHGYGIVQELEEIGDLVAGVSTVYPVLKRLEADGLVVAAWGAEEDGAARRKYYEITDAGAAFLVAGRAQWDTLDRAMRGLEGEAR
jgi:PadR family transcriptional regulator, regulatory protein PadR